MLSLAQSLRKNEREIIGALYLLWSLADRFSDENGVLENFSPEILNKKIGIKRFIQSLPSDWVDLGGDWVTLPNYAEHNGSTSKSRLQVQRRVAKHRYKSNGGGNGQALRKPLPEKRREEKNREEERRVYNTDSDQSVAVVDTRLPAKAKKTICTNDSIPKDAFAKLLADPRYCDGDREMLRDCFEGMRDWSQSKLEKRADWTAALRNWIKTTRTKDGRQPHQGSPKRPKCFDEIEDEYRAEQGKKFLEIVRRGQ